MKQTEITTSKGTFLLIAVPKGFPLYPMGAYAPGSYLHSCINCKEKFIGDKRSVQCACCALKEWFEIECEKVEIIGLASELTEEQVKEIVEWSYTVNRRPGTSYKNYYRENQGGPDFATDSWSLQSLIASSGLVVDNDQDCLIIKKI